MVFVPMTRDVEPRARPDLLVVLYVVQETLKRGKASGASCEPAVQTHRHHLRPIRAFGVQDVEGVLEVGEELIARVGEKKPCEVAKRMSLASRV